MNKEVRLEFEDRIKKAKQLIVKKNYQDAFFLLEEAHILGQRYVIPHTICHLYMLKIGILNKDFKEVVGQLFRIPTGFIGSLVGILPIGNTGGSNVSPFKGMDIPEKLKRIMR